MYNRGTYTKFSVQLEVSTNKKLVEYLSMIINTEDKMRLSRQLPLIQYLCLFTPGSLSRVTQKLS